MFTVEIENEAEFEAGWQRVVSTIKVGAMRGVGNGISEGAAEARARHAFKNRSGDLEKSIDKRYIGQSGDEYQGEIVAAAKYASYVEEGTKAHEIVPRRARILHWEEPQGDHHFSRRVHHPGTKSLPFMGLAYSKCEAVIIRELEVGVAAAQAILDKD